MALFNPGGGTVTIAANASSGTFSGCDVSGLTAGMTINFGSRGRKAGEPYILNTVTPTGTTGGSFTLAEPIGATGFTNAPFVVDVLAGQAPTNGTYASFVLARILSHLQTFLGIGTNLDAASKDVALDRGAAGSGTFARLKWTILGRLWFGAEQRTVGGIETLTLRTYADGTTPIDALTIRGDNGTVDFKVGNTSIAYASTTVDLGLVNTRRVAVTGTGTIASFGVAPFSEKLVLFSGVFTLTHSASLSLPGGKDIVTASGDFAIVTSTNAGDVWTVRLFQRGTGAALTTPNATTSGTVTAFGANAALANLTTGDNTAIGVNALKSVTTGIYEVAVGVGALLATTTGQQNTAIGALCLGANTTGNFNVGLGYGALQVNSVGGSNVAVGTSALAGNTTAGANVAIGFSAAGATTTGGQNVAVGHNALAANVGGASNTAIGYNALSATASFSNTTGLGMGSAVTASNQVQLGDAATTTYAYGAVQNRSDARDKRDVRDTVLGLAFVEALRPVDFRWDHREAYRAPRPEYTGPAMVPPFPDFVEPIGLDPDTVAAIRQAYDDARVDDDQVHGPARQAYADAQAAHLADVAGWLEGSKLSNIKTDGSRKRNRYHHGLIAQEVRDVLLAQGIDFGGFQDHKLAGGDDVLSLGYEEMIGPLIKAVQQLAHRVTALEANAA